MAKIDSGFALLDVKKNRAALRKRLLAGERIEVVIRGRIDNAPGSIGHDDGTSREFSIDVTSVEEVTP
jgi:hypothetical protein